MRCLTPSEILLALMIGAAVLPFVAGMLGLFIVRAVAGERGDVDDGRGA